MMFVLCPRLSSLRWLLLPLLFFDCSVLIRPALVKPPAKWENARDGDRVYHFKGNHTATIALYEGLFGEVLFGCGFYCTGIGCENGSYTFSVFIASNPISRGLYVNTQVEPRVVWSGNWNRPVWINATLEFTNEGDLILREADGSVAWSTGTSGKSVAAMNLTAGGNLVLLDRNNETVWQSFEYPMDTLLLGQALRVGQTLTRRASREDPAEGGLFVLSLAVDGLSASIQPSSGPPLAYFSMSLAGRGSSYVRLANGSFDLAVDDNGSNRTVMNLPYASATQFVSLESTGHLKLYDYRVHNGAVELADLLGLDPCRYPTACGSYGVCSRGNCTCPTSGWRSNYFEERDPERPDRGCSLRGSLSTSCEASEGRTFLEIPNLDYFDFVAHFEDAGLEKCKEACARNCSCRAVFYRVSPDKSKTWCFLPTEVLSMINSTNSAGKAGNHTTAYVKVQDLSESSRLDDRGRNRRVFLASIFTAAASGVILITMFVLVKKKKTMSQARTKAVDPSMEDIPGLPTRYAYVDLEEITNNFGEKLGEGGFGKVYKGTLCDGTEVAVKCLDGHEGMTRYFLAEVESIGSIHHANLVRLLGFCAEGMRRLLVYEHMPNGSLDEWIFPRPGGRGSLSWEARREIVLDVARGIRYLHEECDRKIIHCDVKPQNVLLDVRLRAKVSDFGMSKPVDREQSRVVTAMRGTPGYLAPEWLSGAITEKVDVYGFGMVVLDVVHGSSVVDLPRASEEGRRPSDAVGRGTEDVDEAATVEGLLLRVAAWCLQPDFRKRPSMSMVIKALEGAPIAEEL